MIKGPIFVGGLSAATLGFFMVAAGCGGQAFDSTPIDASSTADAAADTAQADAAQADAAQADAAQADAAQADVEVDSSTTDASVDGSSPEDASDASLDVLDASADTAPDVMTNEGGDSTKPNDASPDVVDAGPKCVDIPASAPNDCLKAGQFCQSLSTYTTTTSKRHAFSLAAEANFLYAVMQESYNGQSQGEVLRITVGTTPPAAFVMASKIDRPVSIALDDKYLYLLTNPGSNNARITRYLKNCGSSSGSTCSSSPVMDLVDTTTHQLIAVGNGNLFAMGDSKVERIYMGAGGAFVHDQVATMTDGHYPHISSNGQHVYLTWGSSPRIQRMRLDGTNPELLAEIPKTEGADPGPISSVATCDALYVIVKAGATNRVIKFPTTGALPTKGTLIASMTGLPWTMAADERFVYVATANAGGITALARGSEQPKPTPIASGNVWNLAVTPRFVFFDEHGSNQGGSPNAGLFRVLKSAAAD